jgi:hypothetical protein
MIANQTVVLWMDYRDLAATQTGILFLVKKLALTESRGHRIFIYTSKFALALQRERKSTCSQASCQKYYLLTSTIFIKDDAANEWKNNTVEYENFLLKGTLHGYIYIPLCPHSTLSSFGSKLSRRV